MTKAKAVALAANARHAGDLHTSRDAKKRLSRRYRLERRFKYLGLGAIMVSVLFLIALLASIVWEGSAAFTYHYVRLPTPLPGHLASAGPAARKEALSAIRYRKLVADGLESIFPFATSRSERRLTRGLLSAASDIQLQREIAANTDEVIAAGSAAIPVSDFADLYLKNQITSKTEIPVAGIASPSAAENEITVLSTSNDFVGILRQVKARLRESAANVRREADQTQKAIAAYESQRATIAAQLTKAPTNGETHVRLKERLAQTDTRLSAARAQRERLYLEAQGYAQRASADNAREALSSAMASFILHINGGAVKIKEIDATAIKGDVIIPLLNTQEAPPGSWRLERFSVPEANRKFSDREIVLLDRLRAQGLVERRMNALFFTSGASREPELAGIWGAVVGSFFTMLVTLIIAFPMGLAAAIYLQEFAPKNRWTDLIEVNINNLAAVPSIVFGLLGVAIFLNVMHMPRSAPLVGGLVLALMTLPTIIIASRTALRAVPPSIREAALGVGASRLQTVLHHVLPPAMPGILTGTIIGMAQALGETAPLLMIGMVAFIVDIPSGITDAATVLPVQIYMWADFPEPAFRQKTAAAIMVLLGFLIFMNAIAIILRKQFERRW